MQLQDSQKKSAIITSIITIILFILLFFLSMEAFKNEVDEGVMVSFGVDGYGEQMSTPLATTSPKPSVTPNAAPEPLPDDNLLTQEDPSVALEKEKKRQENERNEQLERERLKKEEEQRQEEERLRKEEERKIAEQIRQEKAAAAKALTGNAFSNKNSGSGTTTGDSMKGNPTGSGVSPDGGAAWSLKGRSLVSNNNRLYQPSYSGNQQGKIVISIRVDANGTVTSAEIATGTTITDEQMRKASIDAARKNKFSTGGAIAIGTITFHFKLN